MTTMPAGPASMIGRGTPVSTLLGRRTVRRLTRSGTPPTDGWAWCGRVHRKISMDDLPLRDDLRGQQPHRNKRLDAETLLNTNENPHAPSGGLADALGKAVGQAALDANRHPDRDA